jgi:hypothetical protein
MMCVEVYRRARSNGSRLEVGGEGEGDETYFSN